MSAYAVLCWRADRRDPPESLARIRATASSHGWSEHIQGRAVVLRPNARCPVVSRPPHGRLLLIGEWWSERSLLEATARDLKPLGLCRSLTTDGWGRYIALPISERGEVCGVFRDPSGSLDAFVISLPDVTVIASEPHAWLLPDLRPALTIDWTRVGDMVADTTVVSGRSALAGAIAVTPGEFRPLDPAETATTLWHPGSIPRRHQRKIHTAQRELAEVIDRTVGVLADSAGRLMVEVSGGLDSAIIAASVQGLKRAEPPTLINYFGPHAEADERGFAWEVAALSGVPLMTVARPDPAGVAQGWAQDRLSFRPGFVRLDSDYDRAQAELARSAQADAVLTGKGGDAVLFQHATPLVFADLWQDHPVRAPFDRALVDVARWCRMSVWQVLAEARRANTRAIPERLAGRPPLAFANRELTAQTCHPWLEDIGDTPPAKQIQIAAIASNLGLHGPSPQTDVVEVRHPLLMQPVVETVLALPTYGLTQSGRDRGLARQAFAGRIPARIQARRIKGGLAHYFADAIVEGLDQLRPFLMDGLLAQHALLDRDRLELALSADTLIWNAVYGDIMLLTMIEAWCRRWTEALGGDGIVAERVVEP